MERDGEGEEFGRAGGSPSDKVNSACSCLKGAPPI